MSEVFEVAEKSARLPEAPFGLRSVSRGLFFLAAAWLFLSLPLRADSNYYRHIFFDNSLTAGYYFYSQGHVTPPSKLARTSRLHCTRPISRRCVRWIRKC